MPDDGFVGGVVAVAPSGRTGEVEHCLDAPTHATRRYRLIGNQRLEGFEHQSAIDCRNRKIPEDWIGIVGQCRHPLLAMFGVAPLARVDVEIVLGALPECHLLGAHGTGGEHGAVAGLDWVKAAGELDVAIIPQLSRQCERDRAGAAQAHVALAAMTLVLEDPAFAAVGNLEVEVAAIGVAALTTNASNEGGGKLIPGAHDTLSSIPVRMMDPEEGRGRVREAQQK